MSSFSLVFFQKVPLLDADIKESDGVSLDDGMEMVYKT